MSEYHDDKAKDEFEESGAENDPDSSEEEDDDEEEMQRVREGFIVDDEEEEPDEDDELPKKRKKKRRRQASEEPEEQETRQDNDDGGGLDEDDLDLLMENTGVSRNDTQRQFKRLKRATDESSSGLDKMFSDEEDAAGESRKQYQNEFEDFIEEDEFSDDERNREEERDIRSSTQRQVGPSFTSQIAGLDEEKLNDLYEIFGDGEEYDWALEGEDDLENEEEERVTELKHVFEPGELKSRLLTDEDNAIRAEDIPERYQLLRQKCKMPYELTPEELHDEQNWISKKLTEIHRNKLEAQTEQYNTEFGNAVRNVVEFIVQESFDIPFIWRNRRDYLVQRLDGEKSELLLTQDDLWRIVYLDMEYHGMLEKKKTVQKMYNDLDTFDSTVDEAVHAAKTLVDYQDLMDFIQFKYSAEIKQRGTQKEVKRHSRFGRFERIRNSDTYSIVDAFGISVDGLAENIHSGKKTNTVLDPAASPLIQAQGVLGVDDEAQGQHALEEAKAYFAEQIFYHPLIRRSVRSHFNSKAKIDIVLTDKGHKKIDTTSPYYEFKYAINHEYAELQQNPELYLRMLKAETEGLVIVRVSYPDYKKTLYEDMLSNFLTDSVSEVASEWNEERRLMFKAASRKFVPLICRNIKEDLKQDCTRQLYFDVRNQFAQKLDQAPYQPPNYSPGETSRVLALSAGNGEFGKDAVLAVYMDDLGQVQNNFKFDSDPRDGRFVKEFAEAVRDCVPDVICIAGYSVNSSKLFSILRQAIDSEGLTVDGDGVNKVELIWAQDEVARLFQNSERGESEFAAHTPVARYCIALARYVQSPLLEYAALGREISAINIHQGQALLPEELFHEAIESVFVDYVNLVGVEVNEATRNPYIANLVPYISGLGPRKASKVLQQVQSFGGLVLRQELVTSGIMGGNIFRNSASYLYISNDTKDKDAEPLDATRIHPEDYGIALDLVKNAWDFDEEDAAAKEKDGGVVSYAMTRLKATQERFKRLQLEDFAKHLEIEKNVRKFETVLLCRSEILDPYSEKRNPLKRLSNNEVFTMLTGETSKTLSEGVVVPANIRKIHSRFLGVRLGCGVDGEVPEDKMVDPGQPPNQFSYGSTVPAVVVDVNKHDFRATLSTRQSDVEQASNKEPKHPQSRHKWNYEAEERDRKLARRKELADQPQRRTINHALFKNVNSAKAEELLAPQENGAVVIRPSSRGVDHIAVTWKVDEGLYQHLDVVEAEKPSEFQQGKFYVGGVGVPYSDLDDLLANHVGGIAGRIAELTQFTKFMRHKRSEVEERLKKYVEMSRKSQYHFMFDYQHPGYFLLVFQLTPDDKPHSLRVKALPDGYKLNGTVYPTINLLCNAFKDLVSKGKLSGGSQQQPQQHRQDRHNGYHQPSRPGYAQPTRR